MAAVSLSDPGGNTVLKVKVESVSGSLRKKKIGYAPPVFAEPPILFPFTLSRGYTRKEFAEKYGLNHSGMSPKQLRDTDVTDAELVSFFGPTVNKNGHRYMYLNDEALIERIERMWMVCHQKSVVLQSRLITKAMAKGFYVQEVKKKSPNWALYAEWTNNEQLRRRLKSKKTESNAEGFGFSDGEDDGEFEEGGSTQSKVTAQEAGSRHGGVIRDQQGIEVFTAPGGLPEMVSSWKTYSVVAHAQVVEAQRILEEAKSGKDEHMQNDLKARSQVEFCELKLKSTRQKCGELQAAVSTLRHEVDNGIQVGKDLPSGIDTLKSLSHQVQVQESLVQVFEDCLDEANLEFLKVTGGEGFVCSLVSEAELRLMQADRHERAVKLVIGRLEIGTYLYRSVPPRPYSEVVIGDPPVQHVLNKCVACGLGFAPVWAVKLGSCCHPYHEWCSRIHFESSKFCIAPDCGVEMHEGWWVSTGLLKPGIAAALQSTVERFPEEHEASLTRGQLPVSKEVGPSKATGLAVGMGATAVNALGAKTARPPCKLGLLSSKNPVPLQPEIVPRWDFSRSMPQCIEASIEVGTGPVVHTVNGLEENGGSVEENGGSGFQGPVTANNKAEKALQDDEMQPVVNPALKGLKLKSPSSGKKPLSATKIIPNVLPLSEVLAEESTEEEVGEEEDEESVDGEDNAETSEGALNNQKLNKRTPPKRKASKSKSKHNQKKMKVPVAERISIATNTRTAKKR